MRWNAGRERLLAKKSFFAVRGIMRCMMATLFTLSHFAHLPIIRPESLGNPAAFLIFWQGSHHPERELGSELDQRRE